jgi:phospholipid/cholesterol/gamma-HCH transport system permease protein
MREWAAYSLEESGGGRALVVTGPLTISTIGALDRELRAFDGHVDTIDLSQVGAVDTVGAWTVLRFSREQDARIVGADEQAQRLLEAVEAARSSAALQPPRSRLTLRVPETVGKYVVEFAYGARDMLGFAGHIIVASGNVIAQQGAAQLQQFGAEIYTINLTGRLSVRELGVLMTAIMVAGRSGSSFAAQLGTMKLTEEVDAMRTIGVSPMEALVLPRVIAAVVMMPLLGFYSAVLAIIGGAFIADVTAINIPFNTFLERIREVVPLYDVWVGLIKAPVFGMIIGLTGCYQGMQVEGNAEEVGLRTTKAVVQAIFMVIVLDAFFAVFFTEVGWG